MRFALTALLALLVFDAFIVGVFVACVLGVNVWERIEAKRFVREVERWKEGAAS